MPVCHLCENKVLFLQYFGILFVSRCPKYSCRVATYSSLRSGRGVDWGSTTVTVPYSKSVDLAEVHKKDPKCRYRYIQRVAATSKTLRIYGTGRFTLKGSKIHPESRGHPIPVDFNRQLLLTLTVKIYRTGYGPSK